MVSSMSRVDAIVPSGTISLLMINSWNYGASGLQTGHMPFGDWFQLEVKARFIQREVYA